MATFDEALLRLRKLCAKLPEAHETVTFGHPTFRIGKKTFAVLEAYDGVLCIGFKLDKNEQAELVKKPGFFVAPYVGQHGWVGMDIRGKVAWREVAGYVLESYRQQAPKRLLGDR